MIESVFRSSPLLTTFGETITPSSQYDADVDVDDDVVPFTIFFREHHETLVSTCLDARVLRACYRTLLGHHECIIDKGKLVILLLLIRRRRRRARESQQRQIWVRPIFQRRRQVFVFF